MSSARPLEKAPTDGKNYFFFAASLFCVWRLPGDGNFSLGVFFPGFGTFAVGALVSLGASFVAGPFVFVASLFCAKEVCH
jgi:hypothetical protein